MRNIVIGGLVVSALVLGACDDKPSGGNAAPSASASAAPAPSASAPAAASASAGAAPSASGSAGAAPDKPKKAEGPKSHKARAKALAEAWSSHDATKVSALYAEDAVITRPGRTDLKGKADIEKRATENFAAFKDLTVVPGRVWEKDKKVAMFEWVDKGTNTADWADVGIPKATNKTFGVVGASWIEVDDDGLIKTEVTFMDGSTLIGQLAENKKNPVRAAITDPPDGAGHFESVAERTKAAKDDKEKAELAKEAETAKKNLEVEDKFIEEQNKNKLAEALKHIADDYKYVDNTEEKDVVGKKAFDTLLHGWFTAFPDLKVKSTASFPVGNFVVEYFEYTGTQKGALGPIKATNKPVTIHQLEVDEFKEGKFVKSWAYWNKNELLTQLGVPLPTTEKEEKEKKEKKEKK